MAENNSGDISPITDKDLANRFGYHRADDAKRFDHEFIRDACKTLALKIVMNTHYCREQSLALSKIEEAMFWANAAAARLDHEGERL